MTGGKKERRIRDYPGASPGSYEKKSDKRRPELYYLKNKIYYFLNYCFIIEDKGKYRLVVIHDNRVWTDIYFKSPAAAKIAFAKKYKWKSWKKGVIPEWSPFYPLSIDWVKNKIKIAYKNSPKQKGKTKKTCRKRFFETPPKLNFYFYAVPSLVKQRMCFRRKGHSEELKKSSKLCTLRPAARGADKPLRGRGHENVPLIKSFCGVKGQFFQKAPLTAGGNIE